MHPKSWIPRRLEGERSWNGFAILARKREPVLIRDMLPGDSGDKQSRYIEAAVDGVAIASIYLPNGNPQPGPKFKYKIVWFDRLIDHAHDLLAQDVPAVLAGDYNVVPTDFDIYATRSFKDNALLQPAPRAAYAKLLAAGWTDALRSLHPDDPMFTLWSYLRNRWPRDASLRLDHLLLSPMIASRLKAAVVDRHVPGEPEASDHTPAWVELKSPKRGGVTRKRRSRARANDLDRTSLDSNGQLLEPMGSVHHFSPQMPITFRTDGRSSMRAKWAAIFAGKSIFTCGAHRST
jgi:exodeoxyribonuclease-3